MKVERREEKKALFDNSVYILQKHNKHKIKKLKINTQNEKSYQNGLYPAFCNETLEDASNPNSDK